MTARENPAYPPTNQFCYLIGGTHGSLELPSLKIWRNHDRRDWLKPISVTSVAYGFEDPLVRQIRQFAAVIRGDEEPVAPAREGLETLRVIEAVKHSSRTGETVRLGTNRGQAR